MPHQLIAANRREAGQRRSSAAFAAFVGSGRVHGAATYGRAGLATAFDTGALTGNLVEFAAGLRRAINSRLLMEPAFTNLSTNPRLIGNVTGTPGTAPTGWAYNAPPGVGIANLGTFPVNGMTVLRLRFFGTPTASGACRVDYAGPATALTAGTVLTQAITMRVQAGDLTNINTVNHWGPTFDSLSAIQADPQPAITLTSTFTRPTPLTRTVPATGTGPYSIPSVAVLLYVTINLPINVTLDFALPSFGISEFDTSVPLPPVGNTGTSTRPVDLLSMPTAQLGMPGTGVGALLMRAQYQQPLTQIIFQAAFTLSDGTTSNRIVLRTDPGSANLVAYRVTAGVVGGPVLVGALTAGIPAAIGIAPQGDGSVLTALNGVAGATLTGAPTAGYSRLDAWNDVDGGAPNTGFIDLLAYRRGLIGAAQLAAITGRL